MRPRKIPKRGLITLNRELDVLLLSTVKMKGDEAKIYPIDEHATRVFI